MPALRSQNAEPPFGKLIMVETYRVKGSLSITDPVKGIFRERGENENSSPKKRREIGLASGALGSGSLVGGEREISIVRNLRSGSRVFRGTSRQKRAESGLGGAKFPAGKGAVRQSRSRRERGGVSSMISKEIRFDDDSEVSPRYDHYRAYLHADSHARWGGFF